ncbi:hypothetical protein JCM19301_4074 [Jejuia pallidilutea]|uniref:Uncharacterized protein n=1 Tax=Jejuia pallidilutea TaxID=504487 RepID=A0A090WNQ4_9FLAO|nr:hypothetical protein JCM19301_4074 [Jejuia pallidilutea]GAL71688.1 hypothetical protein JCM19302_3178 [Jejuia pallidilutea]GAL89833.1 hypothetical protein JCM19538_1483 [Jejuia pallidilutea]
MYYLFNFLEMLNYKIYPYVVKPFSKGFVNLCIIKIDT